MPLFVSDRGEILRPINAIAACAAALAVLTACASGSRGDVPAASSPTPASTTITSSQATQLPSLAPVLAPFTATVSNRAIGGDCAAPVNCWHPTQFDATLVDGESVSLREVTTPDHKVVLTPGWPSNGDEVEVVCTKEGLDGGSYQTPGDHRITAWHGIRVPESKLASGALENPRLKKTPDGKDYLGFIGASWFTGADGKQAPAC